MALWKPYQAMLVVIFPPHKQAQIKTAIIGVIAYTIGYNVINKLHISAV